MIIPTLVPKQTRDFVAMTAFVIRKMFLNVSKCTLGQSEDFFVVKPGLAIGAGRTEILAKTLATPGDLDQQDLLAFLFLYLFTET